jgi:hypothetical protein
VIGPNFERNATSSAKVVNVDMGFPLSVGGAEPAGFGGAAHALERETRQSKLFMR